MPAPAPTEALPEPAPEEVPPAPINRDEEAAIKLLGLVLNTYEAGDHLAAKGMLEKLYKRYPGTQAQRMSVDVMQMLSIVGRPLPADWESHVKEWFTPKQGLELDKGLVVVLFWEVWCSHCTKEIPTWQERYEALVPQGLKLVALTQITRDATPEHVRNFVKLHGLGFPIAQEDGVLSTAAAVNGFPSAAVYRDGVAIFRGHPAILTDALLSEWLHNP